jgi:hypothetical protein
MNQQAIQLTEGTELGAEEGWLSNLSEAPVEAICQPILDYHRAQERRNLELLSASISDIVYRVYCAATDRFVDWEPWTRLTREQIVGNFGKAFEHPDYHYRNRVDCTHIKVNGREAFVRTTETGHSWKSRTWENVEVLWHSTPADDGRWVIAGHIHHLNWE